MQKKRMEDMTEPELIELLDLMGQQIEMIGRQRLTSKPLFATSERSNRCQSRQSKR